MTLSKGTRLGSYAISEAIGAGGMGEVYRARDTKLDRDVAIKVLPEEFAQDRERLARFEREAKLLASLNHPSIASIHGFEESNGVKALILELVEGPTLAEKIAKSPIPVDEAIAIARQIVEALEAGHESGVIHRDLKPANVKLKEDGTVKVLDYGLAKALEDDLPDSASSELSQSPTLTRQGTQLGVILGTAAYMSPEQAKGLPVDRRSDIFSFGCVLFEMLSGRRAFQGDLATEILASVITREPDESALPANLHSRLKELLRRCFEKDPKNRWQAAGDIRLELARIADDPEGASNRLTDAVPPRATLGLVLPWIAVTAAVVAMATWLLKPTPSPEPRVVSRFTQDLLEDQNFTSTGRSVIAVSPDGRRVVYVANDQLHLRAMHELEARPIPGTDGSVRSPVFSPDGGWVAYHVGGALNHLKKIPISGGAPLFLCDANGPFGMSWGPDDTIVYGQREGIFRVAAGGGVPDLIVSAEEREQVHGPRLLPGGAAVLFTATRANGNARWDEAQIVVHSLDSGERKILWNGGSDAHYAPTGHLVYARENVLFALPFDLERLEVTGGPVPLIEDVRRVGTPAGDTGTANYDLSVSGSLVYATGLLGASLSVLSLVDRTGEVQKLDVPPARYVAPRVSPDGRTVTIQTDDGEGSIVWVYDLSGETVIRRLTLEGSNTYPLWTPDSERITFASDRDGPVSIYWKRADGSSPAERLTTAAEGSVQVPEAWSPDGRTLAFSTTSDNGVQLWTLSLDGESAPEVFADTPRIHGGAAFSPNGKWLAYHYTEDRLSENQIVIEPFPATGAKHRITMEPAVFPVWSHDGRELFFRPAGSKGTLKAVNIETEPTLRFSQARVLAVKGFQGRLGYRSYDPMPDGERFVMLVPAVESTSESVFRPSINVVLNWVEELKARVPTEK